MYEPSGRTTVSTSPVVFLWLSCKPDAALIQAHSQPATPVSQELASWAAALLSAKADGPVSRQHGRCPHQTHLGEQHQTHSNPSLEDARPWRGLVFEENCLEGGEVGVGEGFSMPIGGSYPHLRKWNCRMENHQHVKGHVLFCETFV